MLAIPQLASAVAIVEAPTLPSFLYLPEDAAAVIPDESTTAERWVIGRFARAKAAEAPGRVVHSAKSWLSHHNADRSAPFLPWGSDDIDATNKISPVGAAALILRYMREAWNDRFDGAGDDFAFDMQAVTVAVPASFDAVAQRLTLMAAQEAGFPRTVRLIEEPQAALYRWLELHDGTTPEYSALRGNGRTARHVLVIDIGGGTSDFSLFECSPDEGGVDPHIKRIAVSEHILLGGDNIDLALAHRLEPQLAQRGENLSGRQWDDLVARCRDIKETALSTDGPAGEVFSVSIPGRGSRLIAGVQSAELERAEIERLLLDGFFPHCAADEYPLRAHGALRELGLPYARDPAITRHLADFLRGRPGVDAVLFNGGSLHPQRLRERIRAQIENWQSGVAPAVLSNAEPDLAVAQGAARFGKLLFTQADRIEAGAAHAIFLQAHRTTGGQDHSHRGDSLVCLLPMGAATETTFALMDIGLELRINQLVRFQTYSSARHGRERAGDIVVWNEREFQALPALETSINVPREVLSGTMPVSLTAQISELGHLTVSCVSTDPDIPGVWPLAFNLRPQRTDTASGHASMTSMDASAVVGPNVSTAALAAARARIQTLFAGPINNRDRLSATRLIKSLETILSVRKNEWNVILVRSLWATLEQCMLYRSTSIDHEEAWLIVAGFLLRPGFGAGMDDVRIDQLWTLHETGLCFSTKTVHIQAYVLWRRVSGGLSRQRQERVLGPELVKLREQRNPPPELVLLAGSLERIDLDLKAELVERFLAAAAALEREKKHNAHFLIALGLLLNRAPLYAGPETVVSPSLVQRAFDTFAHDWDGALNIELQTLFLRAARVVDNRSIDVPRSLRDRIAEKLEKSGVPASRTAPLRNYLPLQRSERAGSFGESLPPGLILRENSPA